MAYQTIPGLGFFGGLPVEPAFTVPPAVASLAVIDATGEKIGVSGRFWHPERTSKDVTRLGWRFGAVTKAGGSGLTASLQNVATGAGPPIQPDETQDQTVAIANGNASFVSNTWIRTDALSANRTLAPGDLVSFVLEYDGGGRLGADSVVMTTIGGQVATEIGAFPVALKTGGSWSNLGQTPNLVLECTDGSFGTIYGAIPFSAINTHAFKQDTGTSDEYAATISYPFNCKVDGAWVMILTAANTSDFSLVLYEGTNALETVAIDANHLEDTPNVRCLWVPFSQLITLTANTTYYLAVKPTQTTSNVTAYSFDVNDANHWKLWPGGSNHTYATRLDEGSWAAATTTRRLLAGLHIAALDDGAGAGSAVAMGGSCGV